MLELESSISGNIKNFLRAGFFWFFGFGLGSAGLYFRKYKKFFNCRVRKFHSPKYKELFSGWIFFNFEGFGVGLGSDPCGP